MLKTIGKHRLFVGDITRGALIGLCQQSLADVVYCQPPSDKRQVKWARLKHHAAETTWESFLVALADGIADNCAVIAAVELSEAAGGFPALMEARRFRTLGSLPLADDRGGARRLWYGSRDSRARAFGEPKAGQAPVEWFLSHAGRPGGIVLDPCIGAGGTARAALAAGMVVWGADVDPKKILATKQILEGK